MKRFRLTHSLRQEDSFPGLAEAGQRMVSHHLSSGFTALEEFLWLKREFGLNEMPDRFWEGAASSLLIGCLLLPGVGLLSS